MKTAPSFQAPLSCGSNCRTHPIRRKNRRQPLRKAATDAVESDPETAHQLFQARCLLFQVGTGTQRRLQVFHTFLIEGVDLGDVHVDRLHHRSLFLGSGGHRLVHPVNLTDALGHAVQALARQVGDFHAVLTVSLAFAHGTDRIPGAHAHILQNEDQRIVFTIPYLNHLKHVVGFTLGNRYFRRVAGVFAVGGADDGQVIQVRNGETDYMLNVVNAHFKKQLSRDDIVHTYSGVRPLCNDESDNPSAVTRDYTLALSGTSGEAPLLSVFGGKLTTYRKLAESAMAQLAPYFTQMRPSWTATATLPGGENMSTPEALADAIRSKYDWVPSEIARRWSTTYGSRTWRLLEGVQSLADMGDHLGGGLYTREVDYLCAEEWATQPQDILWRRSKLGLFTTPEEQEKVQRYLSKVEHNRGKIEAA